MNEFWAQPSRPPARRVLYFSTALRVIVSPLEHGVLPSLPSSCNGCLSEGRRAELISGLA
jgi:hypothetical protein